MLIRYSQNKDGKPVKKAVIYTSNEHCIKNEDIDPDALRVITQLKSFGFSAYLVGGAVRDLLLGKTPKDFDIVTDCCALSAALCCDDILCCRWCFTALPDS